MCFGHVKGCVFDRETLSNPSSPRLATSRSNVRWTHWNDVKFGLVSNSLELESGSLSLEIVI